MYISSYNEEKDTITNYKKQYKIKTDYTSKGSYTPIRSYTIIHHHIPILTCQYLKNTKLKVLWKFVFKP